MQKKRLRGDILSYIVLIIISIIWLFPFVGLVLQSFRSYDPKVEYGGMVDYLVPHTFSLDNYRFLFSGETNFLVWTSQVHKVTSSKISDFEIDGITFEVGGKSKKGRQIKDAEVGYLVKDDLEFAAGHSIPIWMFGFIY